MRVNPKKHPSARRNWAERLARRAEELARSPEPVFVRSTHLREDPRFAGTFGRLQAEVERVQRHFTVLTLRDLCVMTITNSDGSTFTRRATDTEIAEPHPGLEGPKQIAAAVGFNAARAAAKRLTRYYGLRSKYVPH